MSYLIHIATEVATKYFSQEVDLVGVDLMGSWSGGSWPCGSWSGGSWPCGSWSGGSWPCGSWFCGRWSDSWEDTRRPDSPRESLSHEAMTKSCWGKHKITRKWVECAHHLQRGFERWNWWLLTNGGYFIQSNLEGGCLFHRWITLIKKELHWFKKEVSQHMNFHISYIFTLCSCEENLGKEVPCSWVRFIVCKEGNVSYLCLKNSKSWVPLACII